jgi:hypothetical protein
VLLGNVLTAPNISKTRRSKRLQCSKHKMMTTMAKNLTILRTDSMSLTEVFRAQEEERIALISIALEDAVVVVGEKEEDADMVVAEVEEAEVVVEEDIEEEVEEVAETINY